MTTDLVVTEVGSGDTLVVFVHGVMGHGRSFDRVAEILDADFRMVWYDRHGYGEHADVGGTPAGVDRHIDDLVDILDGRRAILAGHSFGGVFAIGATVLDTGAGGPRLPCTRPNIAWLAGMGRFRDAADLRRRRPGRGRAAQCCWATIVSTVSTTPTTGAGCGTGARSSSRSNAYARGTPPYDVAALQVPLVYGRSSELVMPVVVESAAASTGLR